MNTNKEMEGYTKEVHHLSMDIVCGMDIITEKSKHSSTYQNTTYYFCSNNCKHHFDDTPSRYVGTK